MVRLLVLFAPAFAIIAAIGIMGSLKPFFTLLKETPHTLAKSKRRMLRVSKEYSGFAVLVIFMMLVSALRSHPKQAVPQEQFHNAYVPTAISASSLPIGGAGLNDQC